MPLLAYTENGGGTCSTGGYFLGGWAGSDRFSAPCLLLCGSAISNRLLEERHERLDLLHGWFRFTVPNSIVDDEGELAELEN